MDKINIFIIILLAIVKIRGDIVSPCPKYFVFEPNKSEDDRWYGIITLQSRETISGVTLDLQFDKSLIQLGNFFGPLTSDAENIKFRIRNTKKVIQPNTPVKVEIYAVYDAFADPDPPKLLKILLNGKEICPNDLQDVGTPSSVADNNTPTIVVNINLPTCGTPIVTTTGLITSGAETVKGQWPWHAALYKTHERTPICGGSLISTKHVLTAAHCATVGETPRNPQDLYVILGKYGVFVAGKEEQRFTLTKIVVHQQFNRSNFFNDIAILHLNQATVYTNFVRPVCLWSQDASLDSVVGKVGTAVGWGRDEKENPITDLLMMAHMPVVNRLDCIYSQRQFFPLFVDNNNFCAGFRNGTSVCNGDSGGGLVFPRPGTSGPNTIWEIRGIVSNTVSKADRTCDPNYFVIFTDVAQYTQWIKDNTK